MTFEHFLPGTVVVAIVLFLLREVLEGVRRWQANERKKQAIRTMIAREIEINHWVIKSLKRSVLKIREAVTSDPNHELEIAYSKNGIALLRVTDQNGGGYSQAPLPQPQSSTIERSIMEIANVDKKMFEAVEPAYSSVPDIQHIRDQIIEGIDDHDRGWLESFTEYAVEELDDCYDRLDRLYRVCTNSRLIDHRVR